MQQKTIADSIENLSMKAANAVAPITDEAAKVMETAKQQIVGDSGTNEQGQAGNSANLQQVKQQKEAEAEAKRRQIQRKLHDIISQGAQKPKEKTVAEKKDEEKKVEQFKIAEKEKKKLKPISVSRGQRQAETQRGASG